jgi:hypothetical protein
VNELPSIEEFEKLAGDIEIGEDEAQVEDTSLPFEEAAVAADEGFPSSTEVEHPASMAEGSSSDPAVAAEDHVTHG